MNCRFDPMALWFAPPADLHTRLERTLDKAVAHRAAATDTRVFFRDDDVGPPCPSFFRLVEVFARHGAPLALAVVPLWLPMRFGEFTAGFNWRNPQWCLHQHGLSHTNHEPEGVKKQEFGPARPRREKAADLIRGRRLLERFLGEAFQPIFTPPWNRCDADTMGVLAALEFKGLSRSVGAKPPRPEALPEAPVSVDLHTKKGGAPEAQATDVLDELYASLVNDKPCGVMFHHDRMNTAALEFTSALLEGLKSRGFDLVPMQDVL